MIRSYTEADRQLQGRCRESRKIANNTYLIRRSETTIAVRLHSTDIVTFHADGRTVLTSGGWQTVTTKARMNDHLHCGRLFSDRGRWVYAIGGTRYPYQDGLTIHADTGVSNFGDEPTDTKSLTRRIRKYVKDYMQAFKDGEVPAPSDGDCFYCRMRGVSSQRPLGEMTQETSHLDNHIRESYFVPSLLQRATEVMPMSVVSRNCLAKAWGDESQFPEGITRVFGDSFDAIGLEQLEKALYRYMKRLYGMQA